MTAPRILLTRPLTESGTLHPRLESLGYQLIRVPVIEIQPCDELACRRQLEQLLRQGKPDGLVCVSRNAVIWGVPPLLEIWPDAKSVSWYAVGEATAAMLQGFGIPAIAARGPSDSETLLQLPELQDVAGRTFLYLAGEGGRTEIETCLRERGASVHRWEVYRRRPDQSAAAALAQLSQVPDILTAMSGDSLQALFRALPDRNRKHWLATRLLVPSDRVAAQATALGFAAVEVAPVQGGHWPTDYLCDQAAL